MLHKLDELFYQTCLRLVKLMLNSYDDSKTKQHQNCDKHVVIQYSTLVETPISSWYKTHEVSRLKPSLYAPTLFTTIATGLFETML